jgi:hypothetical protein
MHSTTLLTEEIAVSSHGEGREANESVLRKIYPNQNGELFNAFLNNRRESKTQFRARIHKKRCGPIREGSAAGIE